MSMFYSWWLDWTTTTPTYPRTLDGKVSRVAAFPTAWLPSLCRGCMRGRLVRRRGGQLSKCRLVCR